MQLDEKTRKAIVEARNSIGAEEAILFGSRALNKAEPDSDVDICFLFQAFKQDPLELMFQLRRFIHQSSDEALDVLVYDRAIFESKATQVHSFEYLIRSEGVIL